MKISGEHPIIGRYSEQEERDRKREKTKKGERKEKRVNGWRRIDMNEPD
jgi:hypothetical protein